MSDNPVARLGVDALQQQQQHQLHGARGTRQPTSSRLKNNSSTNSGSEPQSLRRQSMPPMPSPPARRPGGGATPSPPAPAIITEAASSSTHLSAQRLSFTASPHNFSPPVTAATGGGGGGGGGRAGDSFHLSSAGGGVPHPQHQHQGNGQASDSWYSPQCAPLPSQLYNGSSGNAHLSPASPTTVQPSIPQQQQQQTSHPPSGPRETSAATFSGRNGNGKAAAEEGRHPSTSGFLGSGSAGGGAGADAAGSSHGVVAAPPPPLSAGALERSRSPRPPVTLHRGEGTHMETSASSSGGKREEASAAAAADADAATLDEELKDIYETFAQHVPVAWVKPILRAVTLQTITGRVPPRLIHPSTMFDALSDLSGEFLSRKEYKRQPGSSAEEGGQSNANGRSNGSSSSHVHNSPAEQQQRTPTPPPPSQPGQVIRNINGSSSSTSFDLCHFLISAPSLLRFRLNNLRERRVDEIIHSYERSAAAQQDEIRAAQQQQQPFQMPNLISVPPRAAVAKDIFRPREDDIQFGAHLSIDVMRMMVPGSRLFFPVSSGTHHNYGNSVSGGTGGGISPRAVEGSPPLWSSSSSGGSAAAVSAIPSTTVATPIPYNTCSTVSFESMPSIFFKAQCDARRTNGSSSRQRSSRRRAINPFFEREFVATFAIGNAASCLFATTLTPEFLVGLPTFLTHPHRCVASAIRATLHRLCLVLTAEIQRRGVVPLQPQHCRYSIRAPPVDIAMAYCRDNTLLYASTAGIGGRLFYLSASRGTARIVVDLESEFPRTSKEPSALHTGRGRVNGDGGDHGQPVADQRMALTSLGTSARSTSPGACLVSQGTGASGGTYDMPHIGRGYCDLHKFALAAEAVAANLARGGDEAGEPGLAGASDSGIPPLLPIISRHWTAERLRQKEAMEPRLPVAALLASREFWSVMPTSLVSDLLRVLLMLCRAAAAFTADRDCRRGTQSEAEEAQAEEKQTRRVRQYITSYLTGSTFTPAIRRRLERFYEARVKFYSELDERNALTLQEKLDQQLKSMAQQREANAADSKTSNGGGGGASQPVHLSSMEPNTTATDSIENIYYPNNGNGNSFGRSGHEDGGSRRVSHEDEEESLLTKPLCDAIAATLSALAVERGQQRYAEQCRDTANTGHANGNGNATSSPTTTYPFHPMTSGARGVGAGAAAGQDPRPLSLLSPPLASPSHAQQQQQQRGDSGGSVGERAHRAANGAVLTSSTCFSATAAGGSGIGGDRQFGGLPPAQSYSVVVLIFPDAGVGNDGGGRNANRSTSPAPRG